MSKAQYIQANKDWLVAKSKEELAAHLPLYKAKTTDFC